MISLVCFEPASYEVSAEVTRRTDSIHIFYQLRNVSEPIVWPEENARPGRQDRLYESTCFEAFIGLEGTCYLEVNASPSGDWQYYHFRDYRQPAAPLDIKHPGIVRHPAGLELEIPLAKVDVPRPLLLGLSAVIDLGHHRDYWALRHCGEKPDFHQRDSFALFK